MQDDIRAIIGVTAIFDKLAIPYLLGGSLASSIYGDSRATFDADFLADVTQDHVDELVHLLEPDFYVAKESVFDALKHRKSFNLISWESGFKIDVFVLRDRSYDERQMRHRVRLQISHDPDVRAWVASAEDTILTKLEWYRLGGEVSDRQWNDVLGVVRLMRERLDIKLLESGAQELGVSDLLQRALEVTP